MNKNYRPYLIITHLAKPQPGAKTESKKFSESGMTYLREQVVFSTKINKRDLHQASVIIDIHSRKIIKNRYGSDMDDDQILKHYFEKYNKDMSKFLMQYLQSVGQAVTTVDQLTQLIDSIPVEVMDALQFPDSTDSPPVVIDVEAEPVAANA
jgi:hypothetical protein